MKNNTATRNALRHERSIRRLVSEGLNREQIATSLQMSASSLIKYCRILDIHIPRVANPNSLGNNPEQMARMLAMRADGASLEDIGLEMGVTRERIRQIFARKCPDLAIQPRLTTYKECKVCRHHYHGSGSTCSPECSRSARRVNRWSRDEAVQIMHLRDQGKTWSEVAQQVHGRNNAASWRAKLQLESEFIMSSSERRHYLPTREQYQEDISERPRLSWIATTRARIMQIFDSYEKPD